MRQYVIAELVKSSKGGRRERAAEFPDWAERSARAKFRELCEAHPNTYFELLLVEHSETCLDFTEPAPEARA